MNSIYELATKPLGAVKNWSKQAPLISEFDYVLLWPLTQPGGKDKSPWAASNYLKPDPQIASSVHEITDELQRQGIRGILDIVPNHVYHSGQMVQQYPDLVERDKHENIVLAGDHGSYGWVVWDDLVRWDFNDLTKHDDILNIILEYVDYWLPVAQETKGGVRFDNLQRTPDNIAQTVISHIKDKYPDVMMLGEVVKSVSHERNVFEKYQQMGVDTFLGWAYGVHDCNDLKNYLQEVHDSKIPLYFPLSTHDTNTPVQMYTDVRQTLPRYAVSALMNNGYYGINQWNEYGHPEKIEFKGSKKPTLEKRVDFSDYIKAMNEHAKDFSGDDAKFESHEGMLKATRNGHEVYVNLSIKEPQEMDGIVLEPCEVLVDNIVKYQVVGDKVVESRLLRKTG